jgi:hypothetical protein
LKLHWSAAADAGERTTISTPPPDRNDDIFSPERTRISFAASHQMDQEVNTTSLGTGQFSASGEDEEVPINPDAGGEPPSSTAAATRRRGETTSPSSEHERGKKEKEEDVVLLRSFHPDHPMEPTRLTEVEQLAKRIEERRDGRIPVIFPVRRKFLHHCHRLAKKKGFKSKITKDDLIAFRDEVKEKAKKAESSLYWKFFEALRFRIRPKQLLKVLEKAVDRLENEIKSDYLYYQEFSYQFTKLESRWPWMRNPFVVCLTILFFYYFFSWLLFCPIMKDDSVCPPDVEGEGDYAGWMTTLYFASTTLTTVSEKTSSRNVTCYHPLSRLFLFRSVTEMSR